MTGVLSICQMPRVKEILHGSPAVYGYGHYMLGCATPVQEEMPILPTAMTSWLGCTAKGQPSWACMKQGG